MLLLVVGLVLAGVLLVAAMLVLVWFLLKKKGERSVDVSEEFKGISSRPSFRNAIHQSFVNQTQNTAAVIYTLDEYYDNGKREFNTSSRISLTKSVLLFKSPMMYHFITQDLIGG